MLNESSIQNIAIIGAGGAIGQAILHKLSQAYPRASIHAFSRQNPCMDTNKVTYHTIDYNNEETLQQAAEEASKTDKIDMVIVTTGILHEQGLMPEKSIKDITAENMARLFEVNTILPSLIAKYFLPKMHKDKAVLFAALSARVGSISDNGLGGWYAYRTSKAALNMMLKTLSIEMRRINKQSIIIGLHPGTVKSHLSKPFQKNVKPDKLFTAEFSAEKLLEVIQNKTTEDSGKIFAWDGQEIQP